jgi:hypothetical protein
MFKEIRDFTITIFRVIATLAVIATVMFIVWLLLSIGEVWIHNSAMISGEPYTYSNVNLFQLLLNR